jgi:small subunit ribosomal protein S13
LKDIIYLQYNMETKTEEPIKEKHEERVVRLLSKDIEGKMTIYAGLTKVKGISWALSNAICKKLKINKRKTVGALTEDEIKKIVEFMKNPEFPSYILNRRNDFETGENKHMIGSNLELINEFDIKRLKKIKSYKGVRHAAKLPVRGQRTKGNFRPNRKKGGGIKKANKNEKKT